MKVLFEATVAKDSKYPDSVEDVFSISKKRNSLRIALSDGASESFDSKEWAKILVSCVLEVPQFNGQSLDKALEKYKQIYDLSDMSWSKRNAFDRGSFATLLGVNISKKKKELTLFAVGDSVAVLLQPNGRVETYPYTQSSEFRRRPELFSTVVQHNAFFYSDNAPSRFRKTYKNLIKKGTVLMCMTDAIAEWAFNSADLGIPVWSNLASIRQRDKLEDLVSKKRNSGEMRRDDSTLLIVSLI